MTITHTFVSAKADGGDATLVRPSNWNAGHTIAGTLAWDGATVTASTPLLDLSQTWNNAAVAFTGLKLNITNTASLAGGSGVASLGSRLVDIKLNGTTSFAIDNDGGFVFNKVAGNTFSYLALFQYQGTGVLTMQTDGSLNLGYGASLSIVGPGYITWGAGYSSIYNVAGFGILEQRLGTSFAQTYRVYNTWTDASNYERGVIDWTTTANVLTIGMQFAGTGAARLVNLQSGSSAYVHCDGPNGYVTFSPNGSSTNEIRFATNGFYPVSGVSGLYDLGYETGGLSWKHIALTGSVLWDSGGTTDTGISRAAAKVLQIGDAIAGNANGWLNYGGQARVTSDFSVTSSTALTNITGLSVNVQAGRSYTFEAELYVTDAAAGGVQAAIAGTATATAIQYTGYTIADNAIKGKTNATALATAVGSAVTTETSGIIVRITGTITVNAAGTLTVQMAQNTSNATATVAKRGSRFIVQDMP